MCRRRVAWVSGGGFPTVTTKPRRTRRRTKDVVQDIRGGDNAAERKSMARAENNKRRSILPGFGLTMGYTTLYVSLIVVIPLLGLFVKSSTMSWAAIGKAISDPDLLSSLKLTFGLSLVAGLINVVFGFITAWTLVRYPFPGRKLLDAVIDLPFALPSAVSGITLATLYASNGWLGRLGSN